MTNYPKPEDGAKAYAKNQVREIWELDKFSKLFASHNAGTTVVWWNHPVGYVRPLW